MLEDGRQINGVDYLVVLVLGKVFVIFGDIGFCDVVFDLVKGVDVMVYEVMLDIIMEVKVNSCGYSFICQVVILVCEVGVGKLIIIYVSLCYDDKGCQYLLCECRLIFLVIELVNDFIVFNV